MADEFPQPLASPLQVADLRLILPMVKEDRRIAVCAAFLGTYVRTIQRHAGITDHAWAHIRTQPRLTIGVFGSLALALGLDIRDLMDESLGLPSSFHRNQSEKPHVRKVVSRPSAPPVRRLRLATRG